MDPRNWATDLAGGSRFGYRLLWVLFLSNGIALMLETLSARRELATGKTLAEHCRETAVWVAVFLVIGFNLLLLQVAGLVHG
jgi:NRAMP (natural resistance-associated macrophage protein)-like metal ion transporter